MLIKNIKGFPEKKVIPNEIPVMFSDSFTKERAFNSAREIIGNIPICLDTEKIAKVIYNYQHRNSAIIVERFCGTQWDIARNCDKIGARELAQHLSDHMGEIVKKEE